jgi:DNA-directed RNA polymerase specialized sigma24 family protein
LDSLAERPPRSRAARAVANMAKVEECYGSLFLPLVRRAKWKWGLSAEDAEETVQAVFALACEKLRASGHAEAWLYRVVDQLCVKFLEKNARRSHMMRRWGPSALAGDRGGEEEAYRQEPDQEDSV